MIRRSAFGYRFIADELAERGHVAGENRVQRLCSEYRIWSVFSKKRGLNRKAGTMTYVDWFNHRRLHGEITDDATYTTPAEFEAAYYSHNPMALEAVTQ